METTRMGYMHTGFQEASEDPPILMSTHLGCVKESDGGAVTCSWQRLEQRGRDCNSGTTETSFPCYDMKVHLFEDGFQF